MFKPYSRILLVLISILLTTSLQAETLYVTDRILLGVHTQPNEESPLLDSIPSGSAVEVVAEAEAFKQVKLPNGKTGWVSSGYLVAEKPGATKVDELTQQQQQTAEKLKTAQQALTAAQKKLKTTKQKLSKKDREVQIRIDELSNARTTIRELRKKVKNKNKGNGKDDPVLTVDPKLAEELAAANQEIENLKQQLAGQPVAQIPDTPQDEQLLGERLEALQQETTTLHSRIEIAMANLKGEIPLDETNLSYLKPEIPAWYWAMLVTVMFLGLIGGILWMDYRHRLRHGGFRV